MRPLISLLSVLALALSALAAPVPTPAKIDSLLARPDIWTLKPLDFTKTPEAKPFVWTSNAHDSARAGGGMEQLQLFGMPIVEVVARFEGEKFTQITANIYARGDAGGLTREQFESLLKTTIDSVSAATKVKYTVRGKDASSAVHAEGLIWETPAARYLLEYSFTKEIKEKKMPFRAEFVRLEITPPERTVSLLASAANATRAKFTGPMHVKRDLVTGDVVIPDVPMVDQGEKGYCAVACTERVMRYYGLQVDENELAQIANTDASGGTNVDAMFDAVKKLGARLRVRVRPIEQLEVRQLLTLIKEYNTAAKKGSRAPQLPEPGRMLNMGAIFHAMDPKILEEVRNKSAADVSHFKRDVDGHVDVGTPLLWSVELGLVPEKGVPQSGGGHMRLIIGYNDKTNEILYTDSWGAGHELKRMQTAEAVTITTGLTAIEPL